MRIKGCANGTLRTLAALSNFMGIYSKNEKKKVELLEEEEIKSHKMRIV